ncbi:malto-oligosyltrehalose trehalohydrolase [Paraflavisolibacter sp. H34]|uniref:malto-oligosyltrehalose trehalohydrolase n=1 Tax=Huijunlia imazamoxiresistens TaxID=3127457 RepID=UPI00301ADEBE
MNLVTSAGSHYKNNSCLFKVWAPQRKTMQLHLVHPSEQLIDMEPAEEGYFQITVEGLAPGCRYFFRPDGERDYPDPASHFQPEGVHGPSEVVDHSSFPWQDSAWRGLPFKDLVLYELHVGTFTPEGTFEAIIPRLDSLLETGINAIELMPVAQFPGNRNWGYDGVYPYAAQDSYGGPEGLKKLVDACHSKGMAVFLDVVYNHQGPEGNYLNQFGPYFTRQYCTPWGDALNFDGDWSDGVRDFYAHNPLHWFARYHIDGLRCDAIHTVYDNGAVHFWELVHGRVRALEQQLGRRLYLSAESDLNSPKVVKDPALGGYGFDAQWLDDFHHALYVLLDKEGKERYADFGSLQQLAKAYTDGFVHSGEYVSFRKRRHGTSSAGVPGDRFVVFNLNHDQVGNRVGGERLCQLIDFDGVKLAAAALLLAPYVPLLFMGEEYADETPFFYFVSHSDEELIRAVRDGRKKEFESFQWNTEPPDPQAEKTFNASKIHWQQRKEGKHAVALRWHQKLIGLRRSQPVLRNFNKNDVRVNVLGRQGFELHRQAEGGREHLFCLFNLSAKELSYAVPEGFTGWTRLLDSKEAEWTLNGKAEGSLPQELKGGENLRLSPCSVVVYQAVAEEIKQEK